MGVSVRIYQCTTYKFCSVIHMRLCFIISEDQVSARLSPALMTSREIL